MQPIHILVHMGAIGLIPQILTESLTKEYYLQELILQMQNVHLQEVQY